VAVYILEDDPGVRDSLRFLLEALGHVVFAFPDAETFFRAEPPIESDTMIIDLGLPGVGGADVVRWLQAQQARPKIICISGQSQKSIDEQLRGLGATELLRKPLSSDVIVARL
jgi:FixJ family two-component response regulator